MLLHGLTGNLMSGQFGDVRNSYSFETKQERGSFLHSNDSTHPNCAKITSGIVRSCLGFLVIVEFSRRLEPQKLREWLQT